jgi:hypothetical protein
MVDPGSICIQDKRSNNSEEIAFFIGFALDCETPRKYLAHHPWLRTFQGVRKMGRPMNLHNNEMLLLSRSRLCHYSFGGAWWHLCFYESF